MTRLADVEEIYFRPKEGAFDIEAAAAVIAPIGFSYRDPHVPKMFLIFDNAESRDICKADRAEDPAASLPYVLMIMVEPDEVYINQFAGPRFYDYLLTFIEWLMATFPCRVVNGRGREITDLTLDAAESV